MLALSLTAFAGPSDAAVRIFSYDPADQATRTIAGALTFEFDQRLMFTRVLRVHSTEGEASATLKPAAETVLGPGGLSRLIGEGGRERDLYEVSPTAEGEDLIHAFCPGSSRAWLAFGKLAYDRDLRVRVIGDSLDGGPAHLCQSLAFNFHGEWKVPAGQPVVDDDLPLPKFPY